MRVLVACEYSGRVRDAFIAKGHDAMSCDLLPTEAPGPHYEGDVRDVLDFPWDMMIAHPPCDHLSVSGALHHEKKRADGRQQVGGAFFMALAKADIPRIVIENPVCIMSTLWRPADQTIQPYQFGHDASKRTCLWLKGVQKLRPTSFVPGRDVEWPAGSGRFVIRWANQTDSGQNRLTPSETRGKDRAATYPGIAKAMAEQWSQPALFSA